MGSKCTRTHMVLLLVVTTVFIWSIILPKSYGSWAAEVVPTLVGVTILFITYNRFRLTTLSYVIISILLVLIFIGGHYTYEKVPFFDWLKEVWSLKRNHYDRLGHFFSGFFVIVLREILLRKTKLTMGKWLACISVSIMLAISAMYEILEWLSYKIMQGKTIAEGFLGMQGDQWDAQWDMVLAFLGSVVALLLLSKLHNNALNRMKYE